MSVQVRSTDDKNEAVVSLKKRIASLEAGVEDLVIYILLPELKSYEIIIDLINDTNTRSGKIIGFLSIQETPNGTFTSHQLKSVNAMGEMVKNNGGRWFQNVHELEAFIKTKSGNAI